VRLDDVAGCIVNANHGIMWPAEMLRVASLAHLFCEEFSDGVISLMSCVPQTLEIRISIGEWLWEYPRQSWTSGNRFMTTSGDNIPNGFCQTANPQCAMPTRRGSWICSHLGLGRHMTPNRTAAHRKSDRRRVYLCAGGLGKSLYPPFLSTGELNSQL
jgi:hypothetical protein